SRRCQSLIFMFSQNNFSMIPALYFRSVRSRKLYKPTREVNRFVPGLGKKNLRCAAPVQGRRQPRKDVLWKTPERVKWFLNYCLNLSRYFAQSVYFRCFLSIP
ncbi:hypothetical protein, partial [Desulfovibrio sp. JC010]|uniref:hypothetical protein n=1 Tax=Desulfovibrio sp. JC010 TaxID=2593641 RepID=UPI00193F81F1